MIWLKSAIWWTRKPNSLLKENWICSLLKSMEISFWLWIKPKRSILENDANSLPSNCLLWVLLFESCLLPDKFCSLWIKEGHSILFVCEPTLKQLHYFSKCSFTIHFCSEIPHWIPLLYLLSTLWIIACPLINFSPLNQYCSQQHIFVS